MKKLRDVHFTEHIPNGLNIKLFRIVFEFDDGSFEIFPIIETSTKTGVVKFLRKLANRMEGRKKQMRQPRGLSGKQYLMLERLKKGEVIRWENIKGSETQTLCSLVKRGFATVHDVQYSTGAYCKDTYWVLKQK